MLVLRNILVLTFLLLVFSCGNRGNNGQALSPGDLKEPLIEENISRAKEESRSIDLYVERRDWEMQTTGTGLRYMIYENGNGMLAKTGMEATVSYNISLMDGTVCYTSEENGPKKFLIGRDNVESGIHEGVTLMHVGDKAMFVIPSYLAHGLTGDQHKIPPRSPLVVDLELLRLD